MELESEKRLEAAIGGEKPDRVPTAPLFYYFAARNAGITLSELVHEPMKYRAAMDRCWEDFGPWDAYYPLNHLSRGMVSIGVPMKNAFPGEELGEDESVQFFEEEVMKSEEYNILLEPISSYLGADFLKEMRQEFTAMTQPGKQKSIPRNSHALKSAFGEPRDPGFEIKGWATFAKTLARLLADKSLSTDKSLRYLWLTLTLSARVLRSAGLGGSFLNAFYYAFEQFDFTRYDFVKWRERGVTPLFGIGLEGAFDTFSMSRSMLPFTAEDLFQRPQAVRDASDASADFFVAVGEIGTALTGVKRFIYACHRTSNDFVSPKLFRELAFPSMKRITEELVRRGITVVFHCDGNWNWNLEYLARLPEGKCVFQFDGRTDMRLARKTLGPGHCIFGDVPAAMLAFGSEDDVKDYCKSLIKDIGAEGRFILGAGCEVPPNARPENVRAMLRAPGV